MPDLGSGFTPMAWILADADADAECEAAALQRYCRDEGQACSAPEQSRELSTAVGPPPLQRHALSGGRGLCRLCQATANGRRLRVRDRSAGGMPEDMFVSRGGGGRRGRAVPVQPIVPFCTRRTPLPFVSLWSSATAQCTPGAHGCHKHPIHQHEHGQRTAHRDRLGCNPLWTVPPERATVPPTPGGNGHQVRPPGKRGRGGRCSRPRTGPFHHNSIVPGRKSVFGAVHFWGK